MVKTKKFAVTYLPSKDGFAVNRLRRGEVVNKRFRANTTIVRSTTPASALRKVSMRSFRAETTRRKK